VLFVVLLNIATGIAHAAIIAPALGFEMFFPMRGRPLSMIISLAILS